MSNIDFQNGFAIGVASKGKVIQKIIKINSEIEVITPVELSGNVIINNNISASCNVEITD